MLTAVAIGVVLLAALVVFGTPILQRRLMYFPDAARVSPESAGLAGVEERVLKAPDGTQLIAWYAKARPGEPTILYFHGNAGSLANRAERIAYFRENGIGVLIPAYRSYGGSGGIPSERANVADAAVAYDALIADGVAPGAIVAYGESLGTGVAAQLAANRKLAGLILDAPYTSIVDVAERFYPYLPGRLVMTDRYDTMRIIGSLSAPLLVIHGEADQVIPIDMGRAVFEAAKEPKEMVVVPLAGHSDHHLFGSYDKIVDWLEARRLRPSRERGQKAAP